MEGSGVEGGMVGSRWDAWLPFLFPPHLPRGESRQIPSCFPNHILNHRAAIAIRETRKCLGGVPIEERIWMRSRFYRVQFGPGEQVISRNHSLAHLAGLLGNHLNPLHQLLRMSEKKIQVEAASSIQDGCRLFEVPAFVAICSPLLSCAQIKQEFRCPG